MRAEASGLGVGPEFHYYYGRYYLVSGDYGQAAFYCNLGLRGLYPYAFDREGRDIWEYAYCRTLAYLYTDPQKAVRDAQILAEKAAPTRDRFPQRLRALELLAQAQVKTGDYQGALSTAENYFREWQTPRGSSRRSLLPTGRWFSPGLKLWKPLGKRRKRLGSTPASSGAITCPLKCPKRLEKPWREQVPHPLNPKGGCNLNPSPNSCRPLLRNPSPSGPRRGDEARRVVEGLVAALREAELERANSYLAIPRFEAALSSRITPEAKAKAAAATFTVGRVVLPSAVQAYLTVELTYDFGSGPKTVRLPLLSNADNQLKVLNGTPSILIGTILGLGDLPDKANAFLDEYLAYLGLKR
ncbi:MAG: hypothetical protein RML14_10550 [Meiothermus sp.]|uniref:hypothetical protein n=1 Tax=Meiothermus sp. TaxID=1955249 RepID=UPI00298F1803|nr:hypothetical protein [Meiothermus sp.]MDW8482282.1 hypothetical protein [Meiothermus sp.]